MINLLEKFSFLKKGSHRSTNIYVNDMPIILKESSPKPSGPGALNLSIWNTASLISESWMDYSSVSLSSADTKLSISISILVELT